MVEIRFNYGDKFTQTTNTNTGIGSTIPAAKLDIAGGTSAGSLRVSGIATLSSYQGFVNTKLSTTENLIVEAGQSGSVSGEVVIGTGQTTSVSTGATTGQGGIESLKVTQTFMPPVGGTADRPTDVKPGMVYYNKDFKTIEFWDGNFWKQVDNTTRSGRGVFGGGQPGLSGVNTDDYHFINISTQGNAQYFGNLSNSNGAANWAGAGSAIRGVFFGGSNPNNNYMNSIEYITIASAGDGIDFGDITQRSSYVGAFSSSTRGFRAGGYLGTPASGPTTNAIDYVEINTLGNALDFGDMTVPRYVFGCCSSATRGILPGGSGDNPYPQNRTIDVVTMASVGNAVEFGDMMQRRWGSAASSNSIRAIIAAGRNNSASNTINTIESLTIASNGSSVDFGSLAIPRDRFTSCATQTRSVFIGGQNNPAGTVTNSIEFITIATGGEAQDFGDQHNSTQYAHASCSDSHGGLGGF